MLLACLIAFGFLGLISPYLRNNRALVILLLSAGSIALISPASLIFCLLIALINYWLLKSSGKKSILISGVLFNMLVLLAFHFYQGTYAKYSWAGIPELLGVSFLALQYIDYFFLVHYHQRPKPDRLLPYLSTVLYLPKFFSGPIASLPEIKSQIAFEGKHERHVYSALNRVLLGLFKKLVLANSIATMVHSIMDFNESYPGLTFFIAALLYALQLYFDFSGYSDVAIGVSALWGITLLENFLLPFRQKNWSSFWKSWHASLTAWLWQYIFNPVFVSLTRKQMHKTLIFFIASCMVFTAMALFNGLMSGYFISAGLFALFYFEEKLFNLKESGLRPAIIFVLFSISLIFFRLPSYARYSHVIWRLTDFSHFTPTDWFSQFFAPLASGGTQEDYFNLMITLVIAIIFMSVERRTTEKLSHNKINFITWFILLLLIFVWGVFDSGERFIYMQF